MTFLNSKYQQPYRHLHVIFPDARGLHQLTRTLLEIAKAGSNGAIALEKIRIDEALIKAHSDVLDQNSNYKVELA